MFSSFPGRLKRGWRSGGQQKRGNFPRREKQQRRQWSRSKREKGYRSKKYIFREKIKKKKEVTRPHLRKGDGPREKEESSRGYIHDEVLHRGGFSSLRGFKASRKKKVN